MIRFEGSLTRARGVREARPDGALGCSWPAPVERGASRRSSHAVCYRVRAPGLEIVHCSGGRGTMLDGTTDRGS
jgi:hypothetical protein